MIRKNILKRAALTIIYCKNIALVVALVFSCAASHATFANNISPEYAVKAAYIFNILRFVEWPDDLSLKNKNRIDICMLGDNNFDSHIAPIEKKKIGGKSLRIINKHSLQQTLDCQLVFIGNTNLYPPDEVSKILGDKKIVVVGDDLDFVKNGGMFSFYIKNKKVRLALNKIALEESGLKVSSLLLEVCMTFGDSK